MTATPNPADETLSLMAIERNKRLCDDFENSWKSGERPRIEDYLGEAEGAEREQRLRELLRRELERRSLKGESPVREEYEARFPAYKQLLDDIVFPSSDARNVGASTKDPHLQSSDVPLEALERIDRQCRAFERAWQEGQRPRIEDYLAESESPERARLLSELLHLDVHYRRRNGEGPSAEEYRACFPGFTKLIDAALSANSDDELQESIGKYRMIGLLSEGGQSYVYRAVHPTLQHELIIKVGKHRVPEDGPAQDRLIAEGKVLAELNHPHLARVYDLGVHENRPYLVMEYVRGRNLRQHVGAQRLTPRGAAELVAKMARALHAVHLRGVVHKDIKPENIVIDESGEPRLIDFGLAELQDAWRRGVEDSGVVSGTIPFIAPEQARGETDRVDQRSDIFALGAVLYWLLVGEAPFWDNDRQKALDRARACDFDREALRRRGISRRLERICLKAMAADQEDRQATGEELAGALERFSRRSRRWLMAAAAGALVLLALAAGTWWRGDTPEFTGNVSIESMKVAHYRDRGERETYLGDVGTESYSARFDDNIRVEIKLSRPAYCYLIAFNTDGQEQLCYPETETTPPQQIAALHYPRKYSEVFGLTDGTGLQALVLVVSIERLPSYDEWRTRIGKPPWKHVEHADIEQGVVWRFADNDGMSGLFVKVRGQVRQRSKPPRAFEDLCKFFADSSPDAIHALAFLVRPKD